MAGKFLGRDAIIDTVKGEHRANAARRREGLSRHPIRGFACGCPDPKCGAFHIIDTAATIPTAEEARRLLAEDGMKRRAAKKRKKRR